jgi:hypothetical protein
MVLLGIPHERQDVDGLLGERAFPGIGNAAADNFPDVDGDGPSNDRMIA